MTFLSNKRCLITLFVYNKYINSYFEHVTASAIGADETVADFSLADALAQDALVSILSLIV